MTHLTRARLAALLDGTLPPAEARTLGVHLREPCDTCERVLEAADVDLDTLSRLLEAEAGGEAPLTEAERNEVWTGVQARVAAEGGRTGRRRAVRWGLAGTAVALAAAVLVAVIPPEDGMREKGPSLPAPPEVLLRVVAGRVAGGQFQAERRLHEGDRAAPEATLVFEVETDRQAARYLFYVEQFGEATVLLPQDGEVPGLEPGGSRQVTTGGDWVALSLDDVAGPVTLVAAASVVPLDPRADVVRPWQAGEPPAWVAYDALRLEVAP